MSSAVTNGNGKKSAKRKRSEQAAEDAPAAATDNSNLTKEQKKKAKKEKKKLARESKKREEAATATGEEEQEEEKKEKKEKPKKKKAKKEKKAKKSADVTTTAADVTPATTAKAPVSEVSQAEAEAFRAEHSITVSGDNVSDSAESLRPILSFDQAKAMMAQRVRDEGLVGAGGEAAVQKLTTAFFASTAGFARPTPIQSQCWPILLAKRDVVGIAETGSGKTLAFLLPSLLHIKKTMLAAGSNGNKNARAAAPIVLVMSPTRELAMQTAEVAVELGAACNAKSICIYGGVSKDAQVRELRGGVQIVVATPGRLLDLVNDGALTLASVDYIVLDEADRMLDLGFEEDIRNVMRQVKQQRQTLMFSATWPQIIQKLASEFLASPVKVAIGSQDLQACKRVKQIVEVMDSHARDARLDQLLKQYQKTKDTKIIIFVLYKKEAVRVESMLARKGWTGIQAIHGDKHQNDRTNSLQSFKTGRSPILIATDVAARGLDIPDVEYVINYSFPLTIEDYVHRIGRTGRAGKEGLAHTLFTDFDKARAGELVNVLREAGQEVPEKLTRFGTHVKKKEHKLYGAHYKDMSTASGAPVAPKRITFD